MSNFDTLWLQQSLNMLAQALATKAIEDQGRALPCTVVAVDGSLVTVNFEVTGAQKLPQLQLPKAESQWMRSPTQIGDPGLTVPADTFMGGVSGFGTGIADLQTEYGNMSTLVWIPVAALGFSAAPDPNKPWINGPHGVVISDSGQAVPLDIDEATSTMNLGDYASNLSSVRAVASHADLNTLITDATNGVIAKTLQTLATAIGGAAVTAGIPSAAGFAAILGASGWVKGLSGITPTIPACSSVVRVKS